MNIIEAAQEAQKKDCWFRPVFWAGAGHALTHSGGRILLVPSARGGIPAAMPDMKDLCGERETCSPETVCNER